MWILLWVPLSWGAQHTVGRSAGWTIPAVGSVNYSAWAAAFTLSQGDVLVFKYDASLHDVLQVSEADYIACNASQPSAIYNTGETFITLSQVGTWCFICGVPGHCLAGQKLKVYVGFTPPASIAPNSSNGDNQSPPQPSSSMSNKPPPSPTHESPSLSPLVESPVALNTSNQTPHPDSSSSTHAGHYLFTWSTNLATA
ncbi:hypothetical protein L7F22_004397 [Adiantum nelumboides]|nr:hypothetical protein [Adiantum nelumboides]